MLQQLRDLIPMNRQESLHFHYGLLTIKHQRCSVLRVPSPASFGNLKSQPSQRTGPYPPSRLSAA